MAKSNEKRILNGYLTLQMEIDRDYNYKDRCWMPFGWRKD